MTALTLVRIKPNTLATLLKVLTLPQEQVPRGSGGVLQVRLRSVSVPRGGRVGRAAYD